MIFNIKLPAFLKKAEQPPVVISPELLLYMKEMPTEDLRALRNKYKDSEAFIFRMESFVREEITEYVDNNEFRLSGVEITKLSELIITRLKNHW